MRNASRAGRLGVAVPLLAVFVLAAAQGPRLPAQPAALPPDLALVPDDAVAVSVIRVADLWNGEVGKAVRKHAGKAVDEFVAEMQKKVGFGLGDIERVTFAISMPQGLSEQPTILGLLTTTRPYSPEKLKAQIPELREEKHKGKSYYISGKESKGMNVGFSFVSDRLIAVVAAAEPAELRKLLEREPGTGPSARTAAALRQMEAGKHHLYGVTDVGALLKEVLKELPKELPPDAEPFKPLLKTQLLTQGMTLGKDFRLELVLNFANAGEAKEGAKAINAGLDMVRPMIAQAIPEVEQMIAKEVPELAPVVKKVQAALEKLKAEQTGTDLKLALHIDVNVVDLIATTLIPAVQKARTAADRLKSQNNLKGIGIAFHAYHDASQHFPAHAIYSKDGKPLLSWRVALLPYLEEDALYREFKLDEPWDSPHNQKLLARMPKVYALPGTTPKEPYTTHYQVFTGKDTAFTGPDKRRIASFTDGLSNTVLAVEAAEAVPWTKPEDLAVDAKKPLPKLGTFFGEVTNALFWDGAVHALRKGVAEKVLRDLITPNGGEVISSKDL